MFRVLGELLAPGGERARLIVLIYHRILRAPDPLLYDEMDAHTFALHVKLLASDFNVLPLGEACARLKSGKLPSRAVSITFDDGYADNEEVALPILRDAGIRATFFIATGYSRGGMMFNDVLIEALRAAPAGRHDLTHLGLLALEVSDPASRRDAIDRIIAAVKYRPIRERAALVEEVARCLRVEVPRNIMMTPAQITRLHDAGMEIGAHTVNHPILASVPDDIAHGEIAESKRTLEDITGAAVTLFAYPNGKPGKDYLPKHVRMVRELGFSAAVSTMSGAAHRESDLHELPRFGPWDRDPRRLAMRLLLDCRRAPASAHTAAVAQ